MTATATAPPVLHPVRALAALALGGLAFGTAEFATMGVLPSVAGALRVSEPTAGELVSAYALGVVIGAPVLAVLAARRPRRTVLLLLMGLFVVANLGSAAAPNFPGLLVARFVAGLPHGAYLGIAALAAASLVPAQRRGRAVASVILGLTVANVIGVPVSTAVGQHWGWRLTFVVVGVLGVLTILAVRSAVPALAASPDHDARHELRALRSGRLWPAVAVCVVGCGGMFAVYTYIATTLTTVSGIPSAAVPLVLAVFGLGMTAGTVIGGRLADRSVRRTVVLGLLAVAGVMAMFTVLVRGPVTAVIGVFLIGTLSLAVMPSMQLRLLDVVPQAPTLAASILHSAANGANALGAWACGVVLAAGAGYSAIGWVGCVLAAAGVLLAVLSFRTVRPTRGETGDVRS